MDNSILDPQLFNEQEMRVEHTINIFRGIGIAVIGVINILYFGVYQKVLIVNTQTILAISFGVAIYYGFIALVHHLSKPGKFRPWLKYLTITLDYFILVSKFAALGAEKIITSILNLGGMNDQGARTFVTLTADNVIIFVIIFVLINFLSALRSSRIIILYSTTLAMISSLLMLVQADLSSYAFVYVVLLTGLSGLLTLAISVKFNSLFTQLQTAAQKIQDYNLQLEDKVAERTRELIQKNDQLNQTLTDLEESNRKIIDSIEYARRIQYSLLPGENEMERVPFQSFVIWRPRDIVGGDIYHFDTFESGTLIALFDCTGHGVPGALITMIGLSAIQKITIDEGCLDPAEILRRLNMSIKTALHQNTDQALSDDGLDACICFIDKSEQKMTFAGARLSLTHITDGNVTTIKGDRQSIGYKRSEADYRFSNHTIELSPNHTIYLYTDGIVDQPGGDKHFPFGNKRLRRVIEDCQDQPVEIQRQVIEDAYDTFRGNNDSVDDITVIGLRLFDTVGIDGPDRTEIN